MAYQKQIWENLPSQNTPITAERLNHMEDGIEEASNYSGDQIPVGCSMEYAGENLPASLQDKWLFERGQAISRTEYSELFSVIGTTYGAGDGSTTFNLPNRCGKVAIGLDENDTDFDTLGNTGGEKNHTLTINEIPSHNHIMQPLNTTGASGNQTTIHFDYSKANEGNISTSGTGGGQPHNILQPYIIKNYIIKVK